jgi:hypothetical protein
MHRSKWHHPISRVFWHFSDMADLALSDVGGEADLPGHASRYLEMTGLRAEGCAKMP